jgi:tRNA dimethylallyltransferase
MSADVRTEVIAIFGPTASGKTDVAEALTERIPAEVVSADAMQVYRGLPILTNQPERPTHLVGIWPLDHEASVAEYQSLAHAAIDDIAARGQTPVVAGGTGLYLRAALSDLAVPPALEPGSRERLEALYDRVGPERAHALLAERDPAAAEAVHANDRRRVVRALELVEVGTTLRGEGLWAEETRRPTLLVGLDVLRDEIIRRIEARTARMWERGVEEEVRAALAEPVSRTARTAHGLLDVASLPREEAQAALNLRTRRYAAYQRKWMRRIPGLVSVPADRPPNEVADAILEMARARQRLPARRAG